MTLPDDPVSTRSRGEGPRYVTSPMPSLSGPRWPQPVETKERGESRRSAAGTGAGLPSQVKLVRAIGQGEVPSGALATAPAPPNPSNPKTAVRGEGPGGLQGACLTVPRPGPEPEPDDTAIRGEASSSPRPVPTPSPREPGKTFVRGEAASAHPISAEVDVPTAPMTVLGLLAARQAGR